MLTVCLAISILLAACCRKVNVSCYDERYSIAFVGYKPEEFKQTIITLHDKSTTSQKFIANFADSSDMYINKGDTIILRGFFDNLGYGQNFISFYDVEVYVPSSKKTYHITNVQDDNNAQKVRTCGKSYYCKSRIISFKLDGQQQSFVEDKNGDKYVYLVK